MNPLLVGPILDIGKSLIERFFPDAEAKQKAEAEMLAMMADGELKSVIAQLEVNAREAANPSVFVSGWRPWVGWCCGTGFMWATIGHPVASWYAVSKGLPLPPAVDNDTLMTVLLGMLGLGGMRTFEKHKGVSR